MLEKPLPSFAEWRESHDADEAQLEEWKQRETFLRESRLPNHELADFVIEAGLKIGHLEFYRHFAEKLSHAIKNPLDEPSSTSWRPGLLTKITRPGDIDPWCLMWILREPITEAIRKEITEWQDMPPAGPARAEREKELRELDKDIASLTEKIEKERADARRAGVELAQIHNRESLRKPNKPVQ